MSEEQENYLFPPEQFSGKMVVDRDGVRHRFDLAMTVSGGSCHEFKFCCRSSDGKGFVSDRAYLTSCHDSFRVGNTNVSVRVTIHTKRARLIMNAGKFSNTPVLQFHLPKFLCVSPM